MQLPRFDVPSSSARSLRSVALVLALMLATASQARAASKLVILDFTFLDTAGEPRNLDAEHAKRLAAMTRGLRSQLQASGLFDVVEMPDASDTQPCAATDSACLLAQARTAGADLILAGAVHKFSSLISRMRVSAFDVETGAPVFYRNLSFRGDDDRAWERATDFLLDQIKADPPRPAGD